MTHIPRRTMRPAALLILAAFGITACSGTKPQSAKQPNTMAGMPGMSGDTSDMKAMPGMVGISASSGVHLTTDQIRQFGVTFGTVESRPLAARVRTVGTVMPNEQTLSQVTPKVSGFVDRLYINQTGQHVRRGEPLLTLYSPDLVAAQEELLVAARLATTDSTATTLVEAGKRRLRAWDVSETQIDRVLRSRTAERTITLYAPTTGVVMDKKVVQGQSIQAGDMLLSVANLSDVWVDAQVRELDAASVHIGSPATIEFTSYPGHPFAGHVGFIYPTVEGDARTVTARIVVPNADDLLKPGMYATVALDAPPHTALSVPSSAILNTGQRTLVFVDLGGGAFSPHEVTTGTVAGDYTEILTGVTAGQRVVTSAQYLLDSESNLAETMKSMIGQTGGGADRKGMNMPAPRGSH
jgi:membrane fusion protein, copper/silver efflux system